MRHSGIEPIKVFPAWLQNMLAAVVLFFVVIMTAFFIHEYLMLTSADGDAGYPFGVEEAGRGYATKEIYLARSRWLIAIGGALCLSMGYALWRNRLVLLWGLTLLTLVGALFLFLKATT